MSDTKTIDGTKLHLTPSVFPTDKERAAWQALTPDEQRTAIMRKVEHGLSGPAAQKASKGEIMAEVFAERNA